MKKTTKVGKIGVGMLAGAIILTLCGVTKAQSVPEFKDSLSLSVTEIVASRKLETNIYPNPVKDMLNIMVENAANKRLSIQVISLSGGMILDNVYTPNTNAWMLQIDASKMYSGTYIVRLLCDNEVVSQKLVARE